MKRKKTLKKSKIKIWIQKQQVPFLILTYLTNERNQITESSLMSSVGVILHHKRAIHAIQETRDDCESYHPHITHTHRMLLLLLLLLLSPFFVESGDVIACLSLVISFGKSAD